MYQVSSPTALLRGSGGSLARRRAHVSRTVVLLGLTSLITDVSAEMVVTVLPLYLVYVGGFSPLAFGLVDGLYNGATAFVGLAAGVIGDRWRRHKEVAATGYALSAACKLLLALAGTAVSAIGAIVLLDRMGKGIRTAPRDAMISLSTSDAQLGTAFGVHRAMDTTGAMLGPVVAFGMLALAPLAFHSVFLVSFFLAVVGVGVLVLLVPGSERRRGTPPPPRPDLRATLAPLRSTRYRALLVAGGALSLATASDAFVFLALQSKLDLGTSLFPLLFVGSAAAYMLLAVPMGRLADRAGRRRVLLGGYALLFGVYVTLLSPAGGWPVVVAALGLLGAYYAATDGVLAALGSAVVAHDVRGGALALLRTTTSAAQLVASLAFGALWTVWGIDAALACFAVGLAVAAAFAAAVLSREKEAAHA